MLNKIIKRISKFLIIFLVIFGVMFSNIPFYVLFGVIDGYVKTANIVDRAWRLSQNDNVVDKFASYRNLLEKIKVYEAQAAINFVGGATASGTNTAYNMSLTALTGGIASSPTEGDIVIAINVIVNTTNGNPGVGTAGYTELVDMYRGDSYDTNLSVSYKIMGASPDTTVSCNPSNSGTRASDCVAMVFRGIDSTTPIDVTTTTASSGNSEDVNCPAITPVTPGAIVLCTGSAAGASVDATPIAPSGYTGTYIQTDPGSSGAAVASYKAWSGSGAEDPAPYVMDLGTASANSWAAATLALRPKNDPPTLTVTQPDGTGDTVTVGDPYNITYDLADTDNVVTAAMYYDDTTDFTGTAITGACATAAEGAGATCSWDTTGMTPGTYYVYGITNDGVNPQVRDYSPGVITINALANSLTVSTSGTQAATLNSGDSNQHIGGASTAAFTLQMSSAAVNVNSMKLTEQGIITLSDLTNQKLYYESASTCTYNGIESNVTATSTGETVTFSLTSVQAPTAPNYLCLYFVFNLDAANAVGGETIEIEITNPSTDVVIASGNNTDAAAKQLSGTTTVLPKITGYTNLTESGLNYSGGCSNCGARIGGGAGFKQTAIMTGAGFGTVIDGSQANCAAGAGKGCVKIGTHTIADGNIANTDWTPTQITFSTDSSVAGDTDSDWGTVFGGTGADGLSVTAGGQANASAGNLNFYVFPQITSITQPVGFPGDSAREYDPVDADGVITINGTRFGTAQTGGWVRILGCDATTCLSPTGSATTTIWSNTAIDVQIPTVISDNFSTGTIAIQQGAGGNSKQHTYGGTFRVLPRITGFTPGSAAEGAAVTINGNHFCQSGTCPTGSVGTDADLVNAPAFTANDRVTFTSGVAANYWGTGGWTDTAVNTQVPTGASTGNVTLKSNGYDSNGKSFTVLVPTPNTPANLKQSRNVGFSNLIATGGVASSTPVYFSMDTSSGVTGGTMYMQTEIRPTTGGNSTFSSTSTCSSIACTGSAYCFEGSGLAYSGGSITATSSTTAADEFYHWQTRARYNKSGTDYCSAWQCYPDSGCNSEVVTDLEIDTVAPVISGIGSTPSTNGAAITWNTNELATTQLEYGTDPGLIGSTFTLLNPTLELAPHSTTTLSNLNCGTTYYYRARSKDDGELEGVSSILNFATVSCATLQPSKTASFYVTSQTAIVTNAFPLNAPFSVILPENATTTKSAFMEITGVYVAGAAPKDITVQVNSQPSKTYVVPASSTSHFRIMYPVSPLNTANTLYVTPQTNTTVYISSAKIIVTYAYTP